MYIKSQQKTLKTSVGNVELAFLVTEATQWFSWMSIHYHVRSEGQIVKKAVYIAIGINLDEKKHVLRMWVSKNKSGNSGERC